MIEYEKRCPKCGRKYTAPPALSRVDNKTLICPDCGTREALNYAGLDKKNQDLVMEFIETLRTKKD